MKVRRGRLLGIHVDNGSAGVRFIAVTPVSCHFQQVITASKQLPCEVCPEQLLFVLSSR